MKRTLSIGIILALMFGIFVSPQSANAALGLGSEAPDFSLPGVDGKTYSLKNFADSKLLLVIFTCNHCPTSMEYEERIKKLVTDYKKKSVAIVAISPNDPEALRLDEMGHSAVGDDFEGMKIRAKQKAFNFPYLYDGEKQEVSEEYGPLVTPQVFLFDKSRKCRYIGAIDDSPNPNYVRADYLRDAIDQLLEDKQVELKWTRAMGCSVKWSEKRIHVNMAREGYAREMVFLEAITDDDLKVIRDNDSYLTRVIYLWAQGDKQAAADLPVLADINRMYRRGPFQMITINVDKPEAKVLEQLKAGHVSTINVQYQPGDKKKMIATIDPKWSGATPLLMVIKPRGEVALQVEGEIETLKLRRAIVAELKKQR